MNQKYLVITDTPSGSAGEEILSELRSICVRYNEKEARKLIKLPTEEEVRQGLKIPPDEDVYLVLRKDLIEALEKAHKVKAQKYFEEQVALDIIPIQKRCCKLFSND